LEPFAKRILALLELIDRLLQIVADPFDARQRSFAGQRRLRSVDAVRHQVLLVGLLDALDDASGLNRMSLAMRTY
jgi:hypothetical protein